MSELPVVLVGSVDDPHVRSVLDRVPPNRPTVVFDAATLRHLRYVVSTGKILVESVNDHGLVDLAAGHRGWIRRPLPIAWNMGVRIGSKRSAVHSSWQSLTMALLRNPRGRWLTPLAPLLAAENKIAQLWAAHELRVPAPRTVVSGDPDAVRQIGGVAVAKPLGVDQFWTDAEHGFKAFAATVDLTDPAVTELLAGAPFLLQQPLSARRHLRVVTVRDRAWTFELDARGLPLDWREEPQAHFSWRHDPRPVTEKSAIDLARVLEVGYSSQDWIETDDETFFLDLNPGGQWLFLPEPQSIEISTEISSFLLEA